MLVRRLFIAMLALLLPAAVRPARAADAAVTPELRAALEAPLRKKISALLAEKDAEGNAFRRGAYSRSFTKVDDDTYQVGFHQDTASKGQLKVERLRLTLKRQGQNDWVIAQEEVQDTYEGLVRGLIGQEDFWTFGGIEFQKEGLKLTAGPGTMYTIRLQDKVVRAIIYAPDLAYTYEPPANLPSWSGRHYPALQKTLFKRFPDEFVFKVDHAELRCDPTTCDSLLQTAFKGLQQGGKGESASGGPGSPLGKIYAKNLKETRDALKDNPFLAFRLPDREDHRTWSWEIKRAGRDQSVALGYNNYNAREVTFWHSEYDDLFNYYSQETLAAGTDPYELELRPDQDSRNYDLIGVKGTVALALEPDTLDGDVTYTMKIKNSVRELPFFIARRRLPSDDAKDVKNPRMYVNSIQDESGNELTWVRTSGFSGYIVFREPPTAGKDLSLRLQFRNLDSIRALNPSYSSTDRGGWLPLVRFTDMIQDLDLTLKTPIRYQVLGIGHKVSESVEGDVRITRWIANNPVSFPTVIFGDYISDESAVKASKTDGTQIPVHVWVDKVSTRALDDRAMEKAIEGSDSFSASDVQGIEEFGQRAAEGSRDIRGKQLKAIADQAANALNLYREIYGVDYPYGKLDLVADPQGSFYGQAPASIVYLGFGVFRGEGKVATGALFKGGADLSKFNKDVVAHEVGHQWWGSLINNANTRNYWFVESLAEYSSALFVEAVNSDGGKNKAKGHRAYLDKVAGWRKNILEADLLTGVQDATVTWGGELPGVAYVANVYNKGPYAFHILRETFGDEKFFPFLKALAQQLKYTGIVTRDIQRVAEQSFGGNMDWFFDQWIRGVGVPQYAFNYTVRKTEDGKYLVEGTIRQRVVAGKEKVPVEGAVYRAVIPVTAIGKDNKEYAARVLVEKSETPFKFKVPEEPLDVKFNKNGEVLAQDILVNRGF